MKQHIYIFIMCICGVITPQITHAETLPDIVIDTEASAQLESGTTYVFQHKETGKWLTVANGKLAVTDTKPVTGIYATYLSQYFTPDANGQLAYTLTDVNDPSTGFAVGKDEGNGDAFFAKRRSAEGQTPTSVVYLKDQTGRYIIYYKGGFYSISSNTHAATQWIAYKAVASDHNFQESACTYCPAHQISYQEPIYKIGNNPTSGIASWSQKTTVAYPVTSSTEKVTWTRDWYYVSGNVTLTRGAVCDGMVHIFLCDGAKLTVTNSANSEAGINVSGSNSLNIYAQSDGAQMGALSATGGASGAGIGGGDESQGANIFINGGKITAIGGFLAAGIGGGRFAKGTNIFINGGEVTATGDSEASGIGSGYKGDGTKDTDASSIYINTVLSVYASTSANPETMIANTGSDLASALSGLRYVATHHFDKGFCTICKGYQPATKVTAANCETLGLTTAYKNYYAIQNAGQLYWYAQQVNAIKKDASGVYYYRSNAVLANDITVNDGTFGSNGAFTANGATETSTPRSWTSINDYRGILDGAGHSVSGLYYSDENDNSQGLVAYLYGGTIKNLGVQNSYFYAKTLVGAICGNLGTNSKISSCWAVGNIIVAIKSCAGGIAGKVTSTSNLTIENCYSNGTIKGTERVGGICGYNTGTVANCYSTATVTRSSGKQINFGTICGYNDGTITNCYGNEQTFNGNAMEIAGLEVGTLTNSETGITAQRFASGEIAYKLNGSTSTGTLVWYQKVGDAGDSYPHFTKAADGSNIVYANYTSCLQTALTYANRTKSIYELHDFGTDATRSICTVCNHGFFHYTASSKVTPNASDGLKDKDGNGIYVHDQNTFDETTGKGIMEFNKPLVTIGNSVFSECTGFTGNLVIPNSVTSIGDGAFYGCTGFSSVELKSVPQIGDMAFFNINGNMTVSLSDDSYVYTGDNDFFPTLASATYNRTWPENVEWGTVVVPFAVDAAPEGFEFYSLFSLGNDNKLYLRKVTSTLAAGTPVFVHRSGTGTSLSLTASNIAVNGAIAEASGIALQGTYANVNLTKAENPNDYFIYNNLLYSTQKLGDQNYATIRPFRAYLTTPSFAGAKLTFVVEDVTTNLSPALSQGEGAMKVYNLQGQKLAAPRKGVNIINGKKVLVK